MEDVKKKHAKAVKDEVAKAIKKAQQRRRTLDDLPVNDGGGRGRAGTGSGRTDTGLRPQTEIEKAMAVIDRQVGGQSRIAVGRR